jgi:hypothetical protein
MKNSLSIIIFSYLLFNSLPLHAQYCSKDLTDEFIFEYNIVNDIPRERTDTYLTCYQQKFTKTNIGINFNIRRKDNKVFNYYNLNGLGSHFNTGYSFDDASAINKDKIKFITRPILGDIPLADLDNLDKLFTNNYTLYSSYLYAANLYSMKVYTYPLNKKDLLKTQKYSGKLSFDTMYNVTEDFIPTDKKHGIKKIKFRIQLIHDEKIETCSTFFTKSIEVNLDNIETPTLEESSCVQLLTTPPLWMKNLGIKASAN